MQLWLFRLGYIKGYTTQLHWDYNESLLGMFFLAPRLFNHLKGYSLEVEQTSLHLKKNERRYPLLSLDGQNLQQTW